MCDLWGDFIPAEWIQRVLDTVASRPQDTFLTLTKAPWNYHKFPPPANLWYGVTVDYGHKDVLKITATMRRLPTTKTFLSYEPVMSAPQAQCVDIGALRWYRLVIVGPLNHRGAPVTRREWVEHIIEAAESAGVPVFMKNKCLDPRAFVDGKCFEEKEMRRSLPWVKKGKHSCLAAENGLPVSYIGGCESWAPFKKK
jgi:protein gp37